jgi:DNA-directed RNA polymerase specialized sigma24 family protein
MWLEQSNFSELARVTGIPRTTISQAVKECREYIRQTLIQRGIE